MLDLKNRVSTFLKSEYDPLIPLRVLDVKTVDVNPSRRYNPKNTTHLSPTPHAKKRKTVDARPSARIPVKHYNNTPRPRTTLCSRVAPRLKKRENGDVVPPDGVPLKHQSVFWIDTPVHG